MSIFRRPNWLRSRQGPSGVLRPGSFGLYYGWPSAVNGANGDVERAAASFARFDTIVLGDGLARPDHPDHQRTATILARLRAGGRVAPYGYIDLGVSTQNLPVPTILATAAAWQRLGAAGIMFDDAGADFGVSAARRDAAVAGVHQLGLRVILNAHRPEDAFAGREALAGGDGYLFESFLVADGRVLATETTFAKADAVLALATPAGVAVYALASGSAGDPDDAAKSAYAWWAALLYGFTGFGYTTIDYGARTGQLPWHALEVPDLGSRYRDRTVHHDWSTSSHTRRTDRGTIRLVTGLPRAGEFVPFGG